MLMTATPRTGAAFELPPCHICIVTETYPPEVNGVAFTLAHLVDGLSARGHMVSVVRPRQRAFDGSLVADNITRLNAISHKDEVSFHMSGTEAVMAAVRLARFNTRRQLIVCFSGAYHGWWDGVQPGLGSERDIGDCLTLNDLQPVSLQVIRWRAREIAGVLVNPVQAFHPNSPPPNNAVLLTSGMRKTEDSTSPYAQWLRQVCQVCQACDIPLIFDEVSPASTSPPVGRRPISGWRPIWWSMARRWRVACPSAWSAAQRR